MLGRVHLILEGCGGDVGRVARDGGLSGKSILTVRASSRASSLPQGIGGLVRSSWRVFRLRGDVCRRCRGWLASSRAAT
ncbi:hypothetical protein VD17_23620 [Pseudomonas fluorescens]|uniref:Uncharacterized protein n=1 Tax=Pseudomonas fluorescens TaxID=294 RepID=A0A0F4V357_PSEFL|nr:hypothetical protein VD17_23620 [Pseudomonas fluorescens]